MDENNNNDQSTELSKRELKKQYMEEKKATAGSSKSWLLGLVIVILVAIGIYLLMMNNDSGQEVVLDENSVTEQDHVKGAGDDAVVTLIEYGDFQCPACRFASVMINQLAQEYSDDVRIVYRHYPLVQIHPNAVPSAIASEAAGEQGKFWEMHDILYQRQDEWDTEADSQSLFVQYAGEIGLDIDQFRSDLQREDLEEKVETDLKSANKLGLRGTPSIFINGELIANPGNYEDLKTQVDAVIDLEQNDEGE